MRGWLASMAARVFVLLVVGISAAAVLAFALSDIQRRDAEAHAREQRLADRVVDLAGVLDRAPAALRPDLLGEGPEAARFAAAGSAGVEDAALTQRLAARLRPAAHPQAFALDPDRCRGGGPPPPPPRLDRSEGEPRPPRPPPAPPPGVRRPTPPPPDCRLVALTLGDGQRLRLVFPAEPHPPREPLTPFSPLMLGVIGVAAAALAFLTARFATAPLQRLSRAADALGCDLDRAPLTVEGPLEVRRAAAAFNAMQADLKRRQAERTHMLAAITHDLQTPLTRLRLRLERVGDRALRAQLLGDQAAMVELVRDGLDLARATEGAAEPLQALDVDSLLESLCADAVEAGADVRIVWRCAATVLTRPPALKRCLANLLDNALKHAGAAELAADLQEERVTIRVLDRGPGIPADQLAVVLDPFVRLETSRSRETGGIGLGLTIANLLARRADGRVVLSVRTGGGLEAGVVLHEAFTSVPRDGKSPT